MHVTHSFLTGDTIATRWCDGERLVLMTGLLGSSAIANFHFRGPSFGVLRVEWISPFFWHDLRDLMLEDSGHESRIRFCKN